MVEKTTLKGDFFILNTSLGSFIKSSIYKAISQFPGFNSKPELTLSLGWTHMPGHSERLKALTGLIGAKADSIMLIHAAQIPPSDLPVYWHTHIVQKNIKPENVVNTYLGFKDEASYKRAEEMWIKNFGNILFLATAIVGKFDDKTDKYILAYGFSDELGNTYPRYYYEAGLSKEEFEQTIKKLLVRVSNLPNFKHLYFCGVGELAQYLEGMSPPIIPQLMLASMRRSIQLFPNSILNDFYKETLHRLENLVINPKHIVHPEDTYDDLIKRGAMIGDAGKIRTFSKEFVKNWIQKNIKPTELVTDKRLLIATDNLLQDVKIATLLAASDTSRKIDTNLIQSLVSSVVGALSSHNPKKLDSATNRLIDTLMSDPANNKLVTKIRNDITEIKRMKYGG